VRFEWDADKAAINLAKHGVSFDEACTVFADPLATSLLDVAHSIDEERWLTTGHSDQGQLVIVSHTNREGAIRIIGARPATPRERGIYESGQ
jgi:hypothetical protein